MLELEDRARLLVDKIMELSEETRFGTQITERLLSIVLDVFPEQNKQGSYAFKVWQLADEALIAKALTRQR